MNKIYFIFFLFSLPFNFLSSQPLKEKWYVPYFHTGGSVHVWEDKVGGIVVNEETFLSYLNIYSDGGDSLTQYLLKDVPYEITSYYSQTDQHLYIGGFEGEADSVIISKTTRDGQSRWFKKFTFPGYTYIASYSISERNDELLVSCTAPIPLLSPR